ncbi:hypothetical protein BD626DRAFT_135232 [Schizophyllum amplum]|uniref:Uncharacterized protein n=1 Tax=Schizophyllum amplum TaxID=97359 RepID=A0A550C5P2_9AGAR|nr:hypothetical protein BD626DRAFT_135232 [Auriculariopsis ampla]
MNSAPNRAHLIPTMGHLPLRQKSTQRLCRHTSVFLRKSLLRHEAASSRPRCTAFYAPTSGVHANQHPCVLHCPCIRDVVGPPKLPSHIEYFPNRVPRRRPLILLYIRMSCPGLLSSSPCPLYLTLLPFLRPCLSPLISLVLCLAFETRPLFPDNEVPILLPVPALSSYTPGTQLSIPRHQSHRWNRIGIRDSRLWWHGHSCTSTPHASVVPHRHGGCSDTALYKDKAQVPTALRPGSRPHSLVHDRVRRSASLAKAA